MIRINAENLQVLAKYGALCRLLLRLRRVGGLLDGAWAAMRASGRPERNFPSTAAAAYPGEGAQAAAAVLSPWLAQLQRGAAAARRPLWQLRAQMAHFVNHFTMYLQVASCQTSPSCNSLFW